MLNLEGHEVIFPDRHRRMLGNLGINSSMSLYTFKLNLTIQGKQRI